MVLASVGVRCSSVVRAFAHGASAPWTGVTKAVVCAILSVG